MHHLFKRSKQVTYIVLVKELLVNTPRCRTDDLVHVPALSHTLTSLFLRHHSLSFQLKSCRPCSNCKPNSCCFLDNYLSLKQCVYF